VGETEADADPAVSRRDFLRRSAIAGGIVLPFAIAGRVVLATPAQARDAGAPLQFLDAAEAADLELLGEALVPGAAAAGIVHYVDHQLSCPPAESLLMGKYIGLKPPFAPFYRSALAGVRAALIAGAGEPAARAQALASALQGAFTGKPFAGWSGPPAGFVYFVLRSDAIDVVYGTPAGFERLGVPYMPHILPPDGWST
jgi:hypothetical protein